LPGGNADNVADGGWKVHDLFAGNAATRNYTLPPEIQTRIAPQFAKRASEEDWLTKEKQLPKKCLAWTTR